MYIEVVDFGILRAHAPAGKPRSIGDFVCAAVKMTCGGVLAVTKAD